MTFRSAAFLVLGCCAVSLCGGAALRAQEAAQPASRPVATVDMFGYSGWDGDDPTTAALRERLATHVGETVVSSQSAAFRRKLRGDVIAVTGKPATDVAVFCCDERGGLAVFVGVQGKDAQPLEQRATPTGPDALPPEALALYLDEEKAVSAAIAKGASQEDDTQGYALSADPATRSVQEKMRAFAVAHQDVILQVLRRSGAVQQRQASAALLGYAQRSPVQVRALLAAVEDDDDGVRNNATRALAVLATAGPLPAFNAVPLIGLLYSGVWTDRNKSSSLLAALTRSRDPKLLKLLRDQALPPLIEGARWQSKSHAYFFAILLGRAVGIPEDRIESLIRDGKTDEIVHQGVALRDAGAKR